MNNKNTFFVALILLCCSLSSCTQLRNEKSLQHSTRTISLESFNLRYDNPEDGINAWPKRRELVLQHLKDMHLDLIGMQEVLAHQLDWLSDNLSDYSAIGVGRDDGKRAGEFVPILYNNQQLTLLASGHFWLSETPNVAGSIGWLADLPRVATWAKFSKDNIVFFVFNTHFSHVSDLARQKSAEFLMNYIPTIVGNSPVILMGDFNSVDSDPAYQTIVSNDNLGFVDSGTVGNNQPKSTYNGFGQHHEEKRIDYIFIKQGLHTKGYRTHSIIEGERYISDHFPISTEVELNTNAS